MKQKLFSIRCYWIIFILILLGSNPQKICFGEEQTVPDQGNFIITLPKNVNGNSNVYINYIIKYNESFPLTDNLFFVHNVKHEIIEGVYTSFTSEKGESITPDVEILDKESGKSIEIYINDITIKEPQLCYVGIEYQMRGGIKTIKYEMRNKKYERLTSDVPFSTMLKNYYFTLKIPRNKYYGLKNIKLEKLEPTPDKIYNDNDYLIYTWEKPLLEYNKEYYFNPLIIYYYDWNISGVIQGMLGVLIAFIIRDIFNRTIWKQIMDRRKK